MQGVFFVLFALSVIADDVTYLATFDGANTTTWNWDETNDPVMGGKSVGTFTIDTNNKKGVFNGTCAIVPFLKAPGFCNVISKQSLFKKFPDVSKFLGGYMMMKVRSDTPDYAGFKVGFGAKGIPRTSVYGNPSFKAPFAISGTDWQVVSVKFTDFSYDWSPYTGRCDTKDPTGTQHHCCTPDSPKYCPTAQFLSEVTNVEFWAEGAAGDFHLEIEWIGAGTGESTVCAATEYCCPDAKACLTPTKTTCASEGDKCPTGTICCPLTKLCVKPGKPCVTPCATTEYCCPDVHMCLTPTKPGSLCSANSDCGAGGVCCPLTKLCVSVGKKCIPP
jgi:hypothetical protein